MKPKPPDAVPPPQPLIHTVKEMASRLTRSERFVLDMKRGGFKLPATEAAAVEFLHKFGAPRQFRARPLTRTELYGHNRPSCKPKT